MGTRSAGVDVVVIGAGPAGSTAATFLARGGAHVTLLESAFFPRDKICGDLCTPRAVWMLGRLGLGDLPARQGVIIRRIWTRSPHGVVLGTDIPAHIFGGRAAVIPRRALDEALAHNAVKAGVELVEGAHVRHVDVQPGVVRVEARDGRSWMADVVLGADGSPSVVRHDVGAPSFPDHHAAFAVRAYWSGCHLEHPDAVAGWWLNGHLPAYGWVFPVGADRANVGVVMRADKLQREGDQLDGLYAYFTAMPDVAVQLRGAREESRPRGHHLPYGSFHSPVAYDRVLLLGDAAGFVNPLTGEGIEFAMESGELAAATVLEAAAVGDFHRESLAGYPRRCRQRLTGAFRLNHHLQRLFELPSVVDRVLGAAVRSARARDDLAESLLGETQHLPWRLAAAALGA